MQMKTPAFAQAQRGPASTVHERQTVTTTREHASPEAYPEAFWDVSWVLPTFFGAVGAHRVLGALEQVHQRLAALRLNGGAAIWGHPPARRQVRLDAYARLLRNIKRHADHRNNYAIS